MDGWRVDVQTDTHTLHSSVEFSQLPKSEGHYCRGTLECIQEVLPHHPLGVTGDPAKKTMTTCILAKDALNLPQHTHVYTCLLRLIPHYNPDTQRRWRGFKKTRLLMW